jgi:hypothetical protein
MRNAVALAALLVTGASLTWCRPFGSDSGGVAGDAGLVNDGDPDASAAPPGDGLVGCQLPGGDSCQLPEVCCLSYQGKADSCIARPSSVTESCGAGFSTDTRIAECDDADDCRGSTICCKIAIVGNASVICIAPASCDGGGGERVCDLSKQDCPPGSTCIPNPESPYATCK